jgi:hypothetical protein
VGRVKRLPPYRDGRLHVLADRCSTCVFRPGNLMSLSPGRLRELVKANVDNDAALVCHQTLSYGSHPEMGEALCRGFVDANSGNVPALRLAEAMDIVQPVEPP